MELPVEETVGVNIQEDVVKTFSKNADSINVDGFMVDPDSFRVLSGL